MIKPTLPRLALCFEKLLAVTQRMAYLRSALYDGDPAWQQATDAIRTNPSLGHVQTR